MDKRFQHMFARRGLSLDRLRVLLEIADAGGIARAVGKDPVRQSQYSRQLKELEEYFGTELTRRDGKTLTLTGAGQRLADIIRQNFTGLADFAATCAQQPAIYALGAGDSLLHWKVLPRIGALQKAFPNVAISVRNLQTLTIIDRVRALRLDFGLLRRNVVPSGLASIGLGKLEYALFVPRIMLPDSDAKTIDWVMQNIPMIAMSSTGEFNRKLEEIMLKAGISPNFRLECESFPAACHAIKSGNYAGILPCLAATDLPKNHFVRLEGPLFKKLAREIALVWNPRLVRLRSAAAEIAAWLGANL